ncbi:hypothetical protein [Micromonospora psammae]|uniref:hypothetical protein n=1 Tax=Micromonospora sp. CPCC 205556 TaxID=3122398 RepID=UPI002FEF2F9E
MMVQKYEARFATTESDDKQFFYFADTLEELPVYICITLAFESDTVYSTTGLDLTGAAGEVVSRADSYVRSSASTITVYANHEVTDTDNYVDHLAMDDDKLVQLSLKHFCPEMSGTWKEIRPEVREIVETRARDEAERSREKAEEKFNEAHPMVRFADGKYEVGGKPGLIQPGRYRLKGPVADCYWERSRRDGTTIANDFITNAPGGLTVSLRAGEGFTSEGCAGNAVKWERVG